MAPLKRSRKKQMPLKMPSLKTVILAFLPALFMAPVACFTKFYHSSTNSLMYKNFLDIKGESEIFDGDYVKFKSPSFENKILIKQVEGIEGDEVIVKDGHLFLLKDLGPIKEGATQDSQTVQSISSGVIPKGKVFVRGTSPDSIDSRYVQIGLLELKNLKKVRPL